MWRLFEERLRRSRCEGCGGDCFVHRTTVISGAVHPPRPAAFLIACAVTPEWERCWVLVPGCPVCLVWDVFGHGRPLEESRGVGGALPPITHQRKKSGHKEEPSNRQRVPCHDRNGALQEAADPPARKTHSPILHDGGGGGGRRLPPKRKEEVVQKVARKRAVCRSQFRHRSMELYKLGHSVPTSLCKTKEPYNVCAEKNLQMCYQNGTAKKQDKTLAEPILNTMESNKKDVPLWRSVSLNNETRVDNESSTKNSGNGRHNLPAIVPERRQSRVKSLPERCSKNNVVSENNSAEAQQTLSYNESQNTTEAHKASMCKTASEPNGVDCSPINLSLKNRQASPNLHQTKRTNEVHNNQYLTSAVPKQPSNVPKKPVLLPEQNKSDNGIERNCVYVTAIPSNVLDPQQPGNVIVINFPNIQQQVSRMEKPSPPSSLDSPIISLINVAKSSAESVFNIKSVPVLNRLYIDLSHYLVLPNVAAETKRSIEEALNVLISYVLINLFCMPSSPLSRSFANKFLLSDLRPHMQFLTNSLEVIRANIASELFMEHLLWIVSRNPMGNNAPVPQQVFPNQVDLRGNPPNAWAENYLLQARRDMGVPRPEHLGGVPQAQPRRMGPVQEKAAMPESFSVPNPQMMRPELYYADNRYIPPKGPDHNPNAFYTNTVGKGKPPRGRSRKTNTSKITDKLSLSSLPPQAVAKKPILPHHQMAMHPNQNGEPGLNYALTLAGNDQSVLKTGNMMRRNSDTVVQPQDVRLGKTPPQLVDERRRLSDGALSTNFVTVPGRGLLGDRDRLQTQEQNNNNPLWRCASYVESQKNIPSNLEPAAAASKSGKAIILGNQVVRQVTPPGVQGAIRDTVVKQHVPPDVEQVLQANVIVNTNQVSTELVPRGTNCEKTPDANLDLDKESSFHTETVENLNSANSTVDHIPSSVIIGDNTMEVSRGDVLKSSVVKQPLGGAGIAADVDDVVVERITTEVAVGNGISCSSVGEPTTPVGGNQSDKRLHADADVSIEKIVNELDVPPKLIKLSALKRKFLQEDKRLKKKPRPLKLNDGDVVVIKDNEPDEFTKLDHNQNRIVGDQTVVTPRPQTSLGVEKTTLLPAIEKISDEEAPVSVKLHSDYASKISSPKRILETTEVTHCTLIEGSVETIQNKNKHLFEKPLLYTRPVVPSKPVEVVKPPPETKPLNVPKEISYKKESLTKLVRFQEDSNSIACSFKTKNDAEIKYPKTMEVKRLSPAATYKILAKVTPRSGSKFKPPTKPVAARPSVLQATINPPAVPVIQASPVTSTPAPPDTNWKHWFFENNRSNKTTVSPTLTADQNPKEPLCEIKVDSKVYSVRKRVFDKIPKGKLCYIRESNSFVRYFDDNQMELFIKNLNTCENSAVTNDLLKQVGRHSDSPTGVEISPSCQGSKQGEIITLSKDVFFSAEDNILDAEAYVVEVEKVRYCAPRDFYGFYKFVTGYQIVNNHPPISFQTFLTMHNTNRIKPLFKNYVLSLVEGGRVL
ncbi:hypothetical protein NQ315_000387 [Exocentrus adspersus]|uniref:Uncharacterized protein n=1 Tax=Exocentrus adspersus TaxID=1586481 RepID=A0AAV8VLU6_9CUCU|nr:hypothetical protein NQ315_000387 [Exocentrus adspersus]